MSNPRETINKALTAGAATLASSVGVAMLDGTLELAEVTVAGGLALGAAAAVYGVPFHARDRRPRARQRRP